MDLRRTAAPMGLGRTVVGRPDWGACLQDAERERKEGVPEEETDGEWEYGAVRSQCL